jgi:hypothetical protein
MPDLHQHYAQGTAADSERSLGVRFLGNARAYWRRLMRGAGLDKTVIAESIETEEQLKLVTSQVCHEGRDYLFGRPMTGKTIRARFEMPITLAQMAASHSGGERSLPAPALPINPLRP